MRHYLPLSCSLMLVVALGGQAMAHDHDRDGCTGDGARTDPADQRAAGMRDGKTDTRAAKADAAAHPRHYGAEGTTTVTTPSAGMPRAANMRDGKDSVLAAKAGWDQRGQRDEQGPRQDVAVGPAAAGASAWERAGRMVDGKDRIDSAKAGQAGHERARDSSAPAPTDNAQSTAARDDEQPSRPSMAAPAAAQDQKTNGVPERVSRTLTRESEGGSIRSLTSREEYGRTVYDARIDRPGTEKPLRIKVGEDGGVVWRDDLLERARSEAAEPVPSTSSSSTDDAAKRSTIVESHPAAVEAGSNSGSVPEPRLKPGHLAIEQLPDPVKQALVRESDGRAISAIELKRSHGRDLYHAELRNGDGKKERVAFAADGSLISRK